MKISRIFVLGLSLASFVSCSQDLDLEEYKEEISGVTPLEFNVKFADQESSRRKIRANGHDDDGKAYYKWTNGDMLAVLMPDSPSNYEGVDYTRGVYKVTNSYSIGTWSQTTELTRVNGHIGFANANIDKTHRLYYGYPAGKVNITQYHPYISGEEGWEQLSADFEVTIDATQNGTVEDFEPGESETNTTADYQVGDWNQAVCGGAMGIKPRDYIDGGYLLMWPLFTTAEIDIQAPASGCTIKSIELTAHPVIGTTEVTTNICGTASGTFTCKGGGELEFSPFLTSDSAEGGKQDKLTLNINGEGGFNLEGGKKLRASMFFFPSGDTDISTGRSVVPMKLTIKVTTSKGTKTATFANPLNVTLRGRNHIDLGTLSE